LERSISLTLLGFALGASFVLGVIYWVIRAGETPPGDHSTGLVLVSTLLCLLFLGVGLSLLSIQRSVAAPLAELVTVMKRYTAGDHAVRSKVSPDAEVGALQNAFNGLVQSADDSYRQLKRVDEERSELSATLSHELRTPLTSIRGYAQLLREGDAGPITSDQHAFLDQVIQSSDRMRKLIDDVLEMERRGSEQAWVETGAGVRIELHPLLRDCLRAVDPLARERGIVLSLEGGVGISIFGHPERLRQIFLNLLSNAVKYNRERGRVAVKISSVADAGKVRVEVRDEGAGLSAEECKKLFQKFYRTESAGRSRTHGTGLGLYLTRRWVEALGGQISVESDLGRGSVFAVVLPVLGGGVNVES
jgi:two-component system OmpR family sensor kinase